MCLITYAHDVVLLQEICIDCRNYMPVQLNKIFSFCSRVINIWNSLPNDLVAADTINTFKNRLDNTGLIRGIFDYRYNADVIGTGGPPGNGMDPFLDPISIMWPLVTVSSIQRVCYTSCLTDRISLSGAVPVVKRFAPCNKSCQSWSTGTCNAAKYYYY